MSEIGSAFWYGKRCNAQDHAGHEGEDYYFPRELVNAVVEAEGLDLERLRLMFPQVVAAVEAEGESEWITGAPYEAPKGFEPRYDAQAPTADELKALWERLGELRNGGSHV